MKLTKTLFTVLLSTSIAFIACNSGGDHDLNGTVKIDGSSTVYPLTEAVAEEFLREYGGVRVTVGVSGTGGGFQKVLRRETDINNASREITSSEAATAEDKGIEFLELEVAYDGLAIVVNPENDWLNNITVEELRKIWEPSAQGKITHWNQIKPDWPNEEIHLYGAGTASGTFDYFTEAIMGHSGQSRGDYTSSEDDNVIVQGVSNDKYGLGFFGLAYYEENSGKLKLVPVDNGQGPVTPTLETVKSGEYAPLSRPLFIYVRKDAAENEAVYTFLDFYLNNAGDLAEVVGYIPLKEEEYEAQLEKLQNFVNHNEENSAPAASDTL